MDKKQKEPWNYSKDGTERIFKADKEYMKCPQSEPIDEYGTVQEVANAYYYYTDLVDKNLDLCSNSISVLWMVQKGMSNERAKILGVKKPEKNPYSEDKLAEPQELANMVHHYLDWCRATQKRTWDSRGLNSKKSMLKACEKGLWIQGLTLLHYHEDPERH